MLALGIERDLRSIQRALNTLCEQFEIDCNTNDKPYSYRWKPDAKGLDMPILNEQQSLVLMLAKQYLAGILPANIMQSMEGFFKQADYNLWLMNHIKKGASEWLNKVAIAPTSQPLLPAKIAPEIFKQISTALYQNRFCKCIIVAFMVRNIRLTLSLSLLFNKALAVMWWQNMNMVIFYI